nr:immunoglobulin light chain junction region [Macaca mulatta]
CQKYINSPLSF